MAMDHTNCDHPRTPAGRAACRKAGGPGSTPQKPLMTDAEIDEVMLAPVKSRVRTGGGRSNKPAIHVSVGKAARLDATRILRANADTKDVPPPFRPAVAHAWKAGYAVHTGTPYNAAERVVELRSEHGTVYLTWRCGNPHGVTKVSWRPASNSLFRTMPSVNEALRMLDGEL
jgi:hypothetical protein